MRHFVHSYSIIICMLLCTSIVFSADELYGSDGQAPNTITSSNLALIQYKEMQENASKSASAQTSDTNLEKSQIIVRDGNGGTPNTTSHIFLISIVFGVLLLIIIVVAILLHNSQQKKNIAQLSPTTQSNANDVNTQKLMELEAWIRKAKNEGLSKAEVGKTLQSSGWYGREVESLLNTVYAK